ncbi:MAG: CsgG/HfaB family protein [bacterium]
MNKQLFIYFITALIFCLHGCAPTAAVKKGYDFSRIKKVAVLPFEGGGVTGKIVADDFIRQLLLSDIEVVEREHIEHLLREQNLDAYSFQDAEIMHKAAETLGVDAFFTGTVSYFKADQRFLIMMNNDENLIIQPVIQLNSNNYRKEKQFEEDSYVIYVGAAVSVSARLVDARTGSVVWADRATYEALETSHAVSSIINYFVVSLTPYLKLK